MHQDYYLKNLEEIYNKFNSSPKGLSDEEASNKLEKYGSNEIADKSKKHPIHLFIKQFKSLLILILAVAVIISLMTNHRLDAIVIVFVILFNALFGFFQEYRAEKSIQSLKNLLHPKVKVFRNETLIQIDVRKLVPGDVIDIEEGDIIPADARIISSTNLRTLESPITGESVPVDKQAININNRVGLGDQKNMLFTGTTCVLGKARAIVVLTGQNTFLGNIATDIQQIESSKNHFEIITEDLAKKMAMIAVAGTFIIFIIGFFLRNIGFTDIFLFSIASLVSAIPEGLPAVLTVVLAIGAYRMSKRNAITRNLSAPETLSVVNVIATDKTGTLTQNTMTVQKIFLSNNESYDVTGKGWEINGNILANNTKVNVKNNKHIYLHTLAGFISNNSKLIKNENNNYKIIGDPTEAALKVLGEKAGLDESLVENILHDLPFSSEYKFRTTLYKDSKQKKLFAVGAPEIILQKCTYYLDDNKKVKLTESKRREFLKKTSELSSQALRVIGVAYSDFDKNQNQFTYEDAKNLTFIGLNGMKDPARVGVSQAIQKAKEAGIRVMMLTGDHKQTAIAIAKEIGLINEKESGLDQGELEKMTNKEFEEAILKVNVLSRLTPQMKLKIAKTLQKNGNIVAMTGDGVNDAPALKQANIGIAMGIVGTDTARAASEIVLADDNFASIINAIEEGRLVFTNVKRSSLFLVTTNVAEQVTILATMIFGLPIPLLPAQILWLNLVTDGVCDVALATERGHGAALKQKPRQINEGILNKESIWFVCIMSVVMISITLIFFYKFAHQNIAYARTLAFIAMSFTQLFNALNLRSMTKSLWHIGIFTNKIVLTAVIISGIVTMSVVYNPFLRHLLKFEYVEPGMFFIILVCSSLALWIGEIYKYIRRR